MCTSGPAIAFNILWAISWFHPLGCPGGPRGCLRLLIDVPDGSSRFANRVKARFGPLWVFHYAAIYLQFCQRVEIQQMKYVWLDLSTKCPFTANVTITVWFVSAMSKDVVRFCWTVIQAAFLRPSLIVLFVKDGSTTLFRNQGLAHGHDVGFCVQPVISLHGFF